jgi:hypothetical protein
MYSYDIGFVYRRMDGHAATSIPPYNFAAGGYNKTNNHLSSPVKRGGSLSFLTIFTFAVPELLDLI